MTDDEVSPELQAVIDATRARIRLAFVGMPRVRATLRPHPPGVPMMYDRTTVGRE